MRGGLRRRRARSAGRSRSRSRRDAEPSGRPARAASRVGSRPTTASLVPIVGASPSRVSHRGQRKGTGSRGSALLRPKGLRQTTERGRARRPPRRSEAAARPRAGPRRRRPSSVCSGSGGPRSRRRQIRQRAPRVRASSAREDRDRTAVGPALVGSRPLRRPDIAMDAPPPPKASHLPIS